MIRRINEKSGKRIIVIGLDGASLNYLQPIIDSGKLPNIGRLMNNGDLVDCLSVIPPLTPPAWSTMLTGVNPGKHGIFDFLQPDDSGIFRMVDASFRQRKSFLDHAQENQIRTLSILVPYTFPPKPTGSDLVIAGLGTPSPESDFIRPHDYRDSYLHEFPFLREVDPTRGQSLDTLHSRLLAQTKKTAELTARAMSDFPDWGICFTVFQATDLIPHFYCRFFDKNHPCYAGDDSPPEYRNALEAIYLAIDSFLGECLSIIGKDGGWLMLVSDHGSQPLAGAIGKDAFLAEWLEDEGYLVTGGEKGRAKQTAKARAGALANRLLYLAKRYTPHGLRNAVNRLLGKRKEEISSRLTSVPFLEDVVWEKTRAFCAPGGYGVGLYINRIGDFPNGIVSPGADYHRVRDRICDGLMNLQVAEGVPLFKDVLPREKALWGPYIVHAPDLLLLWREDRKLVENNYTLTDGRRLDPPECRPGTRLTWSGTHRMEGIFGISGEGVMHRKDGIPIPNLTDVMPTILYLAGCGIPSDADGRVLEDMLDKSFFDSNPPQYGPGEEQTKSPSQSSMTESEGEKLLDLLEGLGYLN